MTHQYQNIPHHNDRQDWGFWFNLRSFFWGILAGLCLVVPVLLVLHFMSPLPAAAPEAMSSEGGDSARKKPDTPNGDQNLTPQDNQPAKTGQGDQPEPAPAAQADPSIPREPAPENHPIPDTVTPPAWTEPAYIRNAASIDAVNTMPMLSIVFTEPIVGEIDLDRLLSLDYPLAFAIRPEIDKAREVANRARRFNHEILIFFDLNARIRDDALQQTGFVSRALATLDMAVGATPSVPGATDNNPLATRYMMKELALWGMAFVDNRSFNASMPQKLAADFGLAYVPKSWFLNGSKSAVQVTRVINQAADMAIESGSSVVFLPARNSALDGFFNWLDSDKAKRVHLVPVSQIIRMYAPKEF